VGFMHVCALTSGGAAYCWGHNNGGQLGTGDTVSSETPRPVAGGLTFTAVSAGGFHACGLTAAGDGYCWGSNFHRQLGTGDTVPSTMPRRVAGGLTFTALSAAASHTCALDSNGAAYCWGISDYYYPETRGSPTPVPVMTGVRFVAINSTASAASTCGIDSTGTVRCWMPGGDVYTGAPQWTVPGGLAFTTLSHGYFHSCAVTAQRVGYCWGRNMWGQLGIGSTSEGGGDSEFFTATPLNVMGQP